MMEIKMPMLGMTMNEGTITEWFRRRGEPFREGEQLFAVETDKAVLEVEAELDGVLLEILVAPGVAVPVGTPIARIGKPGETPDAAEKDSAVSPGTARVAAAPAAAAPAIAQAVRASPERLRSSPAARRRGRALGIDLRTVKGSGPGGRIILRDLPGTPRPAREARAADACASGAGTFPLSPMRRAIAIAMSQAAAIPQFRVTRTVDVTRTLELQERLQRDRAQEKISITDFLIQACALALAAQRGLNASLVGGDAGAAAAIRVHEHVHIGVALAVPEGLVVPVLRDADRISLAETASRRRALTAAARSGRLNANQMTGATFTLSNLGPMGVDQFDAIVTPPQAAVLAAGRVRYQPLAEGPGDIRLRRVITLTVTADHRIVDGAMAAAFLGAVAATLEGAGDYRLL